MISRRNSAAPCADRTVSALRALLDARGLPAGREAARISLQREMHDYVDEHPRVASYLYDAGKWQRALWGGQAGTVRVRASPLARDSSRYARLASTALLEFGSTVDSWTTAIVVDVLDARFATAETKVAKGVESLGTEGYAALLLIWLAFLKGRRGEMRDAFDALEVAAASHIAPIRRSALAAASLHASAWQDERRGSRLLRALADEDPLGAEVATRAVVATRSRREGRERVGALVERLRAWSPGSLDGGVLTIPALP